MLQTAIQAAGPDPKALRMCELGAQLIQVDKLHWGVAKKYFTETVGLDHTSFDINGKFGSLIVDLCTRIEDPDYVDAFDIVTNFGTTEHVTSQYECFENIHRLCKTDGIMMHSVPPPGEWPGHGRYYYPLEFFSGLAEANGYEVVLLETSAGGGPGIFPLSVSVLRKTSDAPFMDRAALEALPVTVDDQSEFVGDYYYNPPLKRLWKNTKRLFKRRR